MCPIGELNQIDQEGKGPEWHTAFYYLAEHIRYLSEGRVNHKDLYALVGTDGRYLNHENPLVRKRTAGALSRIVHSRRYAQDMRTSYMQSTLVFDRAAVEVCSKILESEQITEIQLLDYLEIRCWRDVRRGLANEKLTIRSYLDLFRIDQEMKALFSSGSTVKDDERSPALSLVEQALSAMFYTIAFGHLDYRWARALVDNNPTGSLALVDSSETDLPHACLIKFSGLHKTGVVGSWILTESRPFTIGRYTDCDVVETDASISRVHGCVYRKGNAWHYEDMGSLNGSMVKHADGTLVFDSRTDGAHMPITLQSGDEITLGSISRYWFGSAPEHIRYSSVSY